MVDENANGELEQFATSYRDEQLTIHRAAVTLDERLDGELVTRIVLLLNDPSGDTWDVDRVRALRMALGRKATQLELPAVSLTLVAESEAEVVGAFDR